MSVPLLVLPWTPAQRGTVRAPSCCDCGVEDGLGAHHVYCVVAHGHHRAAASRDGTDPWHQLTAWISFDLGRDEPTGYGNPFREAVDAVGVITIRRAYFTAHRGRWTTLIVESVFVDPARAIADAGALRDAIGTAHWGDGAWVAHHVGGVMTNAGPRSITVMMPWPAPAQRGQKDTR